MSKSAIKDPQLEADGLDSAVSAWLWLVRLSFQRQWWSVQSLVAVILVLLVGVLVAVRQAFVEEWETVLFAKVIIVNLYVFLLPLLCLCFGTQALGGDWEERSLVWLLTRPLPRPAIYLAKFVAALPWTLGLTLGGLTLVGALAGQAGLEAVAYFLPAIALGTVAYLSLFQLLGAWFRRSTVIGVVYSFVLEVLVGTMPGLVKRASIGFYIRCAIFDRAADVGLATQQGRPAVAPDNASFYMSVDGTVAVTMLVLITVGLLVAGMVVFSRREYHDLT
jgi:ABC-type transport system involved in multi-copper enzyme maturation permease subunit